MSDILNDMQLYLVEEFVEDYEDGLLSRREALKRIAAITGSMAFATTALAACSPPASSSPTPGATSAAAVAGASPTVMAAGTTAPTPAPTNPPDPEVSVPADDPAVMAETVTFAGADGSNLTGYLARPAADGTYPLILVSHENRGLTPHIQDVTRRLAKAGYTALAVDLLSREGGTEALTAGGNVTEAIGNLPEGQPVADFQSALAYAKTLPYVDGTRVGMVGFCYGGGITWRVATKTPELKAAVPFYGPAPQTADVPGIGAAVLAVYGEQDERINAGIPEIEAAMQANGKTFEKEIYPGVNHAFHNDTGQRYNREQAKAAWARTLAWFDEHVKGG